ncbi:sulfotransferase domain-containing protein [Aerosakkonema funiforme]|uniref:sulfotransferase domain-containing protein n=1 Tax=Aerosakkonema funiforme TaxID=1246630 RepID=UPI0035BA1DE9
MEKNPRLPNLFICGAAKAGTSSLWYILGQHPDIFMPEDELVKEPCYFSNLVGITDEKEYLNIFTKADNQKYIGEASTAYLTDPASPQRLYDFNPNAKIIIMLRNPIQRAYSLYNWMIQDGYEYARTFEEALAKEQQRRNQKIPNFFEPQYYYNYMYFSSGLYYEQVNRYLELFGHNVFIGLFEDFIKDPKEFLNQLWQFLEIKPCDNLQEEAKNPSRKVVHTYISFAMRRITKFKDSVSRYLDRNYQIKLYNTKEGRDFLLKLVTTKQKPNPIKPDTYKRLREKYKDEYEKIESNLKLNLDAWRKIDEKFIHRN